MVTLNWIQFVGIPREACGLQSGYKILEDKVSFNCRKVIRENYLDTLSNFQLKIRHCSCADWKEMGDCCLQRRRGWPDICVELQRNIKGFWVPDCLGNDDRNKATATSSKHFLAICCSGFGWQHHIHRHLHLFTANWFASAMNLQAFPGVCGVLWKIPVLNSREVRCLQRCWPGGESDCCVVSNALDLESLSWSFRCGVLCLYPLLWFESSFA